MILILMQTNVSKIEINWKKYISGQEHLVKGILSTNSEYFFFKVIYLN